jgi:ribose 1,5-bisphosphokinase
MAGSLVLVVGPSGAGKDTLITAARTALAADPRFVFPRRTITRDAVAALEDHDSVSPEAFDRLEGEDAFALSWRAHGLSYGIPRTILEAIAAGQVVVVNGSRAIAETARRTIPETTILLVEATPAVRAARLAGRGRETAAEVARRLEREVPDALPGAIRVDNSGELAAGTAAFLAALRSLAAV